MSKIIGASIDLAKIDKSKIKTTEKGQKFYDITILVNDTKNQFGQDVSIIQGQTKEEREQKVPRIYLGNGKTVYDSSTIQQTSEQPKQNTTDDLLF